MEAEGYTSHGELIILEPAAEQRAVRLSSSRYRIGQDPTCNIVLNKVGLSRIHAILERQGQIYTLIDNNSTNGTWVNGQKLTAYDRPVRLQNRSRIQFCQINPVILEFRDENPTAPEHRLTLNHGRFFVDGRELVLTDTPQRLLAYLYNCSYSICSYEDCAFYAFESDHFIPDSDIKRIHVHINAIRKSIRDAGSDFDAIKNENGKGYMLKLT